MATNPHAGTAPPLSTQADSTPQASFPPGWLYLANIIGLCGVLLILVGEMLETERWRPLLAACLFNVFLLIQFVGFWLNSRRRVIAARIRN